MKKYLECHEKEMLTLLEKLVNIDSGSMNKAGVDKVGQVLFEEFEKLGFQVDVIPQEIQGNHLVIRHQHATTPKIMAVAHMDTVFKEGTVAERPFTIRDGRAYGPGVIDMKGSHVVLLFALKALRENNSKALENIEVILTSDEEIGSHTSRELIESQTEHKKYALIMEPARQDGSLVTARRGVGEYSLYVTGKAAHSGVQPQAGSSAIEELAQKTIKLHKLTNHDEGITVNVGVIEGGTTVNTVAPSAVARVDVRIDKIEQADWIERQIESICATPDVEGTTIELKGGIERQPMVKNEQTIALLEKIQEVGRDLGIEVKDMATGGGSDASFTSAKGVATIDGLGPIGGHAHSEDEYLEIASLTERALLLAHTIRKLTDEMN
ncbi:M20 family metallopeptidase [Sporosarcina pasteurii]|uniref:Carboxypeptidase G2 n=1 Tax=Sporosarcina pasteurii TaxID=1474 RepID=A0A380BEK9_SPOPA|nr:M20 family metallopeptidase [Sporosarcina pasteurii]MDS9472437.1 M20 family metallopeptidase [Sporosarcina pasteurii]QBQ05995.1 M20 family peptidase [Sporosarcina pasteurii]SUI99708.1 Carboxypeptidase G2 precursor [Sporosarcina pasteurii]